MIRAFLAGMLVAIILAFIGAYVLLQSGYIPANADAQPGGLELWAAKTSLSATLLREAPDTTNPVPLTDQTLLAGVNLFAQHCAICHGTAKGDASTSPIARGMYPRPPQLASHGVEDDSQGISYWKIKHGIRLTGMPSWTASLDDRKIWTLALFLKNMDKLPPRAQLAWTQVKN